MRTKIRNPRRVKIAVFLLALSFLFALWAGLFVMMGGAVAVSRLSSPIQTMFGFSTVSSLLAAVAFVILLSSLEDLEILKPPSR